MSPDTTPVSDQAAALKGSSPSPRDLAPGAQNAQVLPGGSPKSTLVAGDPFPEGNLLTAQGEPTTFAQAVGGKASVVVFYRGAWCPVCNLALRTYNETLSAPLRDLGVELVAISPQKPDGSLTMKEKNQLEFTVLSDPGNQIAGQLGILSRQSDEQVASDKASGFDIEEINADGTATLTFPTTSLVRADGTIEWIDVHLDYTTRSEPAEILSAVHSLLGK
ncbi:peroxiredoxin-like family protein [uncultured Arthrobacter sp.]|uniref:peroxiredoxin-like family protein n=1 Tax=uncultured Arthrobacter sp. TaxID=114050 RepID=UPI0025D53951|nr:peroxiredoxin-like family protein [uncultured Arthrobacter sp.]